MRVAVRLVRIVRVVPVIRIVVREDEDFWAAAPIGKSSAVEAASPELSTSRSSCPWAAASESTRVVTPVTSANRRRCHTASDGDHGDDNNEEDRQPPVPTPRPGAHDHT